MTEFKTKEGFWGLVDVDDAAEGGFGFRQELVRLLKPKYPDFDEEFIEANLFGLDCVDFEIKIKFSEENFKDFQQVLETAALEELEEDDDESEDESSSEEESDDESEDDEDDEEELEESEESEESEEENSGSEE